MKAEELNLEIKDTLTESLIKVIGSHSSIGEMSLLPQEKELKDATTKILIKDQRGSKIAIALFSSSVSPNLIAQGTERSRLAKQKLGLDLGSHILDPLCEGKFNACSYVVYPYCRPLSNSHPFWYYQRSLLSPSLLRWLRQLTKTTNTQVSSHEIERNFIMPLKYLVELEAMTSENLRLKASQTLERLNSRKWEPRYVLMHNDLWKGNIIIDHLHITNPSKTLWTERFVIIDWLGSMVKGYAIYDLVRLAQSLKLRPKKLRHEVSLHCRMLNCNIVDARSYLLTALGYLGMHLEYFPFPRFIQLANSCLETLEEIL